MPRVDAETRKKGQPRPGDAWRGLAKWRADIAAAARKATGTGEVQQAMTRATYVLGTTLAVIAAFGVAAWLKSLS
jgi:hypothetical protein